MSSSDEQRLADTLDAADDLAAVVARGRTQERTLPRAMDGSTEQLHGLRPPDESGGALGMSPPGSGHHYSDEAALSTYLAIQR